MTVATATPNYFGSLTAGAVDVIMMDRPWTTLQVVNLGSSDPIYYTLDGSTPAVGGTLAIVVSSYA